jgi:predicted DNA-binding transcriptional regulator YafY
VRSDRLLALLLLLQARGRVTAPEVAEELEVSVRTVYRDVAALSSSGVPVYTEQGHGGGIHLLPGYRTDVTGLTAEEARALVALTGQAVPDDLGLGTALSSGVRKLVAAVPASHRDEARKAGQRVLVDHTGWYRTTPPTPQLPAVQEAVWGDRRLRLRYRHGDGRVATYRLDPYGLVVKAGVWYLIAADRGTPRVFRADRVHAATVEEEPAARPADLDLAELWQHLRRRIETPREAVRVRLRVCAEVAPMLLRVTVSQRTGPAPDAAGGLPAPGPDGRVELELGFRSTKAARGALTGFGDAVEVIAPAELRAEILSTAQGLVALYGGAAPGGDP